MKVHLFKNSNNFEQYVSKAFQLQLDQDLPIISCPVLGVWVIVGKDSLFEAMARAARAVQARDAFERTRPPGCPTLPLKRYERALCAKRSALGRIVASYTQLLCIHDFHLERVPTFLDYAGGMLGHPIYARALLAEDRSLAKFTRRQPADAEMGNYFWFP